MLKHLILVKNPKNDRYQNMIDLPHWSINTLIKKAASPVDKSTSSGTIKNEIIPNKELAGKLQEPIIKRFERRKVHPPFIGNVLGANLEDMQMIDKFNRGFRFLLGVINIYSKYASVIPLKGKKWITITNGFQKKLDERNSNPNEIWVDKGNEFCNRSMELFLQNNGIKIYSTHNEGKSAIAGRFIRTLKNKIYKYET